MKVVPTFVNGTKKIFLGRCSILMNHLKNFHHKFSIGFRSCLFAGHVIDVKENIDSVIDAEEKT